MSNKNIKFLIILLIGLIYLYFFVDPRPMTKMEYVTLILPIVLSAAMAVYVRIRKGK